MLLSDLSGEPRFWIKNEASLANPWLMTHKMQASCYGTVEDLMRDSTKPVTFGTEEEARGYLTKHPDARREKNALYKGIVGTHHITFVRVGDC